MVCILQLCRSGEKLPSSAFHSYKLPYSLLWWALHWWSTGLEFGSPLLPAAAHLSAGWCLTLYIFTHKIAPVFWWNHCFQSAEIFECTKRVICVWRAWPKFVLTVGVLGGQKAARSHEQYLCGHRKPRVVLAGCCAILLPSAWKQDVCFGIPVVAVLCFSEVALSHSGGGNLCLLWCTLRHEVLNIQCIYKENLQQVANKTIFSKQTRAIFYSELNNTFISEKLSLPLFNVCTSSLLSLPCPFLFG